MYQVTFGVTAKPLDNMTIKLDYHNTWLVSNKDEWRFANQTPLGSSALSPAGTAPAGGYAARYTKALAVNPSNYMGAEIDLIATYGVTKLSGAAYRLAAPTSLQGIISARLRLPSRQTTPTSSILK